MSPVGVGIIGAGVISATYLENLTSFAGVEVRRIADLDVDRAAERAAEFGVAASGTVDELLADDSVDIVVNLTIPAVHAEVATRIVDAGKHVWGEKPLALDVASGRALLDHAGSLGRRVASAPDTLLGAGLQTAARTIASGAIGTPLAATAVFQVPGPDAWHPNPDFLFARGAGPLFDMGPYYLSALVTNLGPVAEVTAAGGAARRERVIGSGPRAGETFPVEVPTTVQALLRFRSGASAQLTLSFDTHRARAGVLEIIGSAGTLVLPDPNGFDGASTLFDADNPEGREIPAEGHTASRGTGVAELAEAIAEGRPERASGALALHVLEVMESIESAIASGETVHIVSTVEVAPPLAADWDPARVLA
ncbi:Gfo/Idh/MocA family protein [Mycetocola reblochoni]|uniref:NADH-dependent dehydrogenase n=2 Tax=Mycetocola reblochoni TaxID=331618 RepID=A0A1R4JX71_9MICO|nr:Gfo/Idh/MocA family oxidoreductase [Mycetocola reblochoni]RLP70612.1 gfo/Idh/MocA family oxidoreductase [Mycetocola reblochoni]SJN36569.1 NADH-dependent dehydrogenase [Mycetocola reblochoni REB411]